MVTTIEIGSISHLTRTGRVVVRVSRADKLPELGSLVYDDKRNPVGRVADIIGPVNQPFLLVKPLDKEKLHELREGQRIYYKPKKPVRRKRRGRRPPSRRARRKKGGSR